MKRHFASKHDSRDYIERIQQAYGRPLDLQKSSQVELIEPEDGVRFLVVDGKYTFVEMGETIVPFVGSREVIDGMPAVRIDDGAVKYILKGADVMRPGISSYDDWGDKDRLVIVRDQAKGRGLAVGRSMVASSEMQSLSKGACVKNVHHAGDKAWDAYKKI